MCKGAFEARINARVVTNIRTSRSVGLLGRSHDEGTLNW